MGVSATRRSKSIRGDAGISLQIRSELPRASKEPQLVALAAYNIGEARAWKTRKMKAEGRTSTRQIDWT